VRVAVGCGVEVIVGTDIGVATLIAVAVAAGNANAGWARNKLLAKTINANVMIIIPDLR
jgi:hypothetical protein